MVALLYDGLCAFEFGCATEIFGLARPEFGPGWYRLKTCSVDGRPVRGQFRTQVSADGGLELLARAGTIVVPGWTGIDAEVPQALVKALRTAHRRGARLVSICSGAVVLAASGLLNGKKATTHWRYCAALQERFPRLRVDAGVLYADEGRLLTSAGSAAGLDLCLHLIRRDFGAAVANVVARRLVIPPHRDGGQAQFVSRPVERHERGPVARVLDRARREMARPLTITTMARWGSMSPRTLIRRVHAATGLTPADWLTTQRIGRARDLLERTSMDMDRVAAACGLGTASTMRHHFRRRVGLSPSDYRRRFSEAAPADG